MLEGLGTFLAGLALFFVGLQLVSNNLKQMTSRRFRLLVTRWTDRGGATAVGAAAGAIFQTTTAVTFVLVSMIASGLLTVRKALPVLLGANMGTVIVVCIAVLDMQTGVLFGIGVTGICLAFERLRKYQYTVGALFGNGIWYKGTP